MTELKSNYKILKENSLLIVVHTGLLNLNSMLDFIKNINLDPLFSPKLNHIVDLNEITFDLNQEDLNSYAQLLKDNFKMFGEKKIALITSSPNQVVYSTLFKEAQEQLQPLQSVEIFSTLKSAYNFININSSFEEISTTLNSLKKELLA